MIALRDAGFDRVPILIKTHDGVAGLERSDLLTLRGQFRDERDIDIANVIPLTHEFRAEATSEFSGAPDPALLFQDPTNVDPNVNYDPSAAQDGEHTSPAWLSGPCPINFFYTHFDRTLKNPRDHGKVHISVVNTQAVYELTDEPTGKHWFVVAWCV